MKELNSIYIKKIKKLLGDDWEAYLASFEEGRTFGLRVNELKIKPEVLKNKFSIGLEQVPFTTNGYYYEKNDNPAKNPYYYAGLYYIQEPSAMMPVSIMPIEKGDKVLDLCSAPGGKTTQIAAKLGEEGVLVANDISASRLKASVKNVELFGIKNSVILSESPTKLSKRFGGYFDKILVDAPCSGEGMFRKEPSMMSKWSEDINEYYQKIQKEILVEADKMLKEGGYLTYSTCTFAREENEDIIKWLIDEFDYSVEAVDLEEDVLEAVGNTYIEEGDLKKTLRLLPHRIKGEGHFVALLKKNAPCYESHVSHNFVKVPEKIIEPFMEFVEKYVDIVFEKQRLMVKNNKVYYLPETMPALDRLRILRNGWYLGELKKNRFEPSQSFASGLKAQQFKNVIDLDSDDIRVIKYLKGESIEVEGEKGYYLVCLEGHALGFGKLTGRLLKNKFEPSWRLM